MIEAKSIMIVGDVHADFPRLNKLMNRQGYPDVVIQVGDFGWWPHVHNTTFFGGNKLFDQYGLRPKDTKIFWCEGNHDNHDDLQERVKEHGRVPIEVQENVFYCPRGSTIQINNLNYLFMGGAHSIDKIWRVPGLSWWAGENISEKDLLSLPIQKVDVVISHTAPSYFKLKTDYHDDDPNRKPLDYVFNMYQPKFWFFGHHHISDSGRTKGCTWRCLDKIDGAGQSWFNFVRGVESF